MSHQITETSTGRWEHQSIQRVRPTDDGYYVDVDSGKTRSTGEMILYGMFIVSSASSKPPEIGDIVSTHTVPSNETMSGRLMTERAVGEQLLPNLGIRPKDPE